MCSNIDNSLLERTLTVFLFYPHHSLLRLLAAIVGDLWQHQRNLPGGNLLIHSSDVNLERIDALSGQIKRLYGNGYDAVITADVAGASSNTAKIDRSKKEFGDWYLAQSAASSLLLASFGSEGANKGLSMKELKLHLIAPEEFNHNLLNSVADELERSAYYLYTAAGNDGKRYWFFTKPNINILINQSKEDIRPEAIKAETTHRIKDQIRSDGIFSVLVEPSEDIPEQKRLTLVIAGTDYNVSGSDIAGKTKSMIEKIATKRGNSERLYRNTMLFLLCAESALPTLQENIREYLACRKVLSDYSGQLDPEPKSEVERKQNEAGKKIDNALAAAYSVVAKHSASGGIESLRLKTTGENLQAHITKHLPEALKAEEWLLESIGEQTLRNANLFPMPEHPVRVRDIFEAFLRYDDKPMITGKGAVQSSLERYCRDGRFCIASGDGTEFTRYYFQESVPSFSVEEETYWLTDKNAQPQVPPQSASQIKRIAVSGTVSPEQYSQLFTSFIMPLTQNNIEIEIRITGASTSNICCIAAFLYFLNSIFRTYRLNSSFNFSHLQVEFKS
jgi:hypothetical protein